MTRRLVRPGALVLAALLAAACAGPPAPDAAGAFAIERFFDGGNVSRGEIRTLLLWREAFTADFSGAGSDAGLDLDERFHFADGERLQRWRLRALAGGRYEGTVETENGDGRLSVPVPVEGYRTAAGFVMDYDGHAPGGGSTVFHFRHVMESLRDGTVSNRVRISKFGIPIAGADVVFSKAKPPEG